MEEIKTYFLQPGYIFFSKEHYIIETILGSCVSICLWDEVLKIGGMNHYIYAFSSEKQNAKYGKYSINYLIKMMKEEGCKNENIKAFVAGGARNDELSPVVGEENIKIALEILSRNKINILIKDIGGNRGRKIKFDNYTGEFNVRIIEKLR